MKNTTLARKPSTTLKKDSGTSHEPRRNDQAGDGADFAFNGQMGDGVNRSGNRYAGNQSGLTMRENYGMAAAARKGNASDSSKERREQTGPSATKDKDQLTIATASQGHPVGSTVKVPGFANPDAINVGMK